ncbi:MAG: twin-arginine translocation pathway signal [Herminiimonas sp.]|nr:twin-arginine translocation pathway signal [Herminiimonas sp.]
MQRRHFILKTAASFAATGLALSGCSSTTTGTVTPKEAAATDKRRSDLEAAVDTSLMRLNDTVPGSREVVMKASGVLVFPRVIAAGLLVGGQYGEGTLRIKNKTVDYYNLASISIGLQAGAQSKALFFLFMTPEALEQFRKSAAWTAGIDASVAMLKVGANGSVDVNSVKGPVVAFALTNAGLMANLSLEGTKITRLKS